MPSKAVLVFEPLIVERFRAEAAKRTRRFSRNRWFLNRIANILDGRAKPGPDITVQTIGIILEPSTRQYWPLVKEVCDAVPGIRWTPIEFGSLGKLTTATALSDGIKTY